MNVRFLETFLWVARMRSFSAAAVRLHSTQAAVSKRIATLEQDLGTRLFERDGRDVRLTKSGSALLERAVDIVRLTNEIRASATHPELARKTVAVGAIDLIAHAWLPGFVRQVCEEFADIEMSLCIDSNDQLIARLLLGEIDLGLVAGPVEDVKFVNLELGKMECGWFGAPKTATSRRPVDLATLFSNTIVTHTEGSRLHNGLLQFVDAHDDLHRSSVRVINANSIAAIIRLVSSELGVACIPLDLTVAAVEAGQLARIKVEAEPPPVAIHAVFPERSNCAFPAAAAQIALASAHQFGSQRQLPNDHPRQRHLALQSAD